MLYFSEKLENTVSELLNGKKVSFDIMDSDDKTVEIEFENEEEFNQFKKGFFYGSTQTELSVIVTQVINAEQMILVFSFYDEFGLFEQALIKEKKRLLSLYRSKGSILKGGFNEFVAMLDARDMLVSAYCDLLDEDEIDEVKKCLLLWLKYSKYYNSDMYITYHLGYHLSTLGFISDAVEKDKEIVKSVLGI